MNHFVHRCGLDSKLLVTPGMVAVTALFGCFSIFTPFAAVASDVVKVESNWYLSAAVDKITTGELTTNYKEGLSKTGVTVTTVGADDSRPGWKFNVGFDVSQNVAIEAGYLDLNEVEGTAAVSDADAFNTNAHADGFTLGSTYRYSVSQNFGLTGSVGVFSWDGDNSAQALAQEPEKVSKEASGTDFYFGLGGGYQLFDDVTLSIEWEKYKIDKEDAEVWSIGVDYHFK